MGATVGPGAVLGAYRLERELGRGAESVVYLAHHDRLDREVALKVLAPYLTEDPAFRERFVRESRIAARLDHPSIVTVYDAGEVGGSLFIAMRFVDGTDLSNVIRTEGALDPDRALLILRQVAAGLDAAHLEGLVHRDVKPGNILLTSTPEGLDRAFLSDFGVAKRITTSSGLTRTGQFVGTVDFVAPEQIRGEPVDGRADVYALGCVLWTALAGRPPFVRDTELATVYAHLQDPPPRLEEIDPALTAFDGAITRALAKDPDERFSTCGALVEAARSEREAARPTQDVPGASPDDHAAAAPTGAPPHGRRRLLGGVMALAAVAVLAGVVLLLDRGPDPAPSNGASSPGAISPSESTVGPAESFTWRPVPEPDAFVGSGSNVLSISEAARLPNGFLAVGRAGPPGDGDAAVWAGTPDGLGWDRIDDLGLSAPGDQWMAGVVRFGAALVAVGGSADETGIEPRAWVSFDRGVTWDVAFPHGAPTPGDQSMADVIVFDNEVVAVGSDSSAGSQDLASWSSPDARAWRRETVSTVPGPQAGTSLEVFEGRLLAAGWTRVPGSTTDRDGAIWTRGERTWTPVSDPGLRRQGAQEILDLAVSGGGWVAVGSGAQDESAAAWFSPDGLRWTAAAIDGDGPDGSAMQAVLKLDPGYVAAGWTVAEGRDAAFWTSADGRGWQPSIDPSAIAAGSDQGVSFLTHTGDHLLALGVSGMNAAAWGGTPAG